MTDPRRRRTAVIDAIEVEVSDDGVYWADPEEEGLDPTDLYEISKVVTHVQFYKNGKAGLWIDFTIGNTSSEYFLKVKNLNVGLENSWEEIEPDKAPAGEGYQREIPAGEEFDEEDRMNYLWNEKIDRSELDRSELELENSWTTMYDYYDEEHVPDELHNVKGSCQYDRIFFHEAGSGDNRQHLISDPVVFTEPSRLSEDFWKLSNFETMASCEDNCLVPEEKANELCWGEGHYPTECNGAEHRNAITLWVLWDQVDVMRDHTEIDFNFEFGIESKIGEIRNLYMYYILPEGGEFIESKSSVQVFQPRKNHWMFGAWFRKTGIDRTGPENRILRSKNLNEEFDADLGKYRLERRRMANELLQSFIFTLIPALFGAFASALVTAFLFKQDAAIPYPVPHILIGMIAVIIFLQGYGIYVTIFGKYTWASAGILMMANYIDKTVIYIRNKVEAIYDAVREDSN